MIPIIQTFRDNEINDIRSGKFYDNLQAICKEHRLENRALAFAFILYNPARPQINKILNDKDYWRALHETSGRYLSIFYIPQYDTYFGEDLDRSDGVEKRGLHPLKAQDTLIPVLKPYFELDEKTELPAVLFFQEHKGLLTDYFLVNLDESRMEESFWELYRYIETAVTDLKRVDEEYYGNSKEIFDLLKSGVEGKRLKRKIFKMTQSFPLQLLAGWITGKI